MRIVSLCPSLTELVFDLGHGDELVGRTKFCIHPADRIGAVEKVGGTKDPKIDRIIELAPDFLEEGHHHHHDEDMQSVSVRHPGAVDPDKFMPWISDLTQREGPNILRCKGIVAFPGEPKRFVFQGVHMILDGDLQGTWKDGETRQSRVVFIGRNLDEDAIRAGFLSTAA